MSNPVDELWEMRNDPSKIMGFSSIELGPHKWKRFYLRSYESESLVNFYVEKLGFRDLAYEKINLPMVHLAGTVIIFCPANLSSEKLFGFVGGTVNAEVCVPDADHIAGYYQSLGLSCISAGSDDYIHCFHIEDPRGNKIGFYHDHHGPYMVPHIDNLKGVLEKSHNFFKLAKII